MTNTFAPTPAELALVSQIFAQADPQKLGVLTGDVAVRLFGGAHLPPTVLGEIWNVADEENKGWLPKKGVAIAVRLIGWAQKGEKITPALVNKPGPLAVIEGITVVSQQTTGMSLSKSPSPAFPPLTPQDKAKFQNMFHKYGPVDGLLSGDKARDIFVKSKLSNEQLSKIWNLADTQDRGALDATDFTIGMYFIQGVMTGKISFIPTSLPPGLYQQAGGPTTALPLQAHVTGTSGSFSPVGSAFAPQPTGQSQMLQSDYTGSYKSSGFTTGPSASVLHNNGYAQDWDITPAEKASSDALFQTLDKQKKGYIEGDVAVPFMLKSQLPGEILAQVWDLADFNNDGRLTSEGFAIAMHLIQKKLAGKDIPATLPRSLIPPSARSSAIGTSSFSSAPAQVVQQPEPVVDLFSFDDPPSAPAALPQPVNAVPNVKAQSPPPTFPPAPSKPNIEADPFNTSIHRDFLSDDDLHTASSPPLQDQSAEIGNLKNQLQSTNRSLTSAKEEREALEQTLANQASLLSTIQTQLSSAKAAYETETNLLASLKERRSTQIADIQKAREELIRAESDLSAVRVEKAEIEGAFLRDKEEARDLHKRMVETGKQADALRADVEKLKKEAKQQKGLLAIARKQLSTKEAEKAKAEKEHEEAMAELTSITQEKEEVETEVAKLESESVPVEPKSPTDSLAFAAAQPLPVTPEIPSPAKSNNPFERLAMSSGNSTPRPQSPFLPLSGTILASPSAMEPIISQPASISTESVQEGVKPPEPDLFNVAQESTPNHVVSPTTANGTEYFLTPPTSAVNEPDQTSSLKERFPSLDDLPPPVSLTSSIAPPSGNPVIEHPDTDLNIQLKEMDIEESDSDEDSDFHEMKATEASAANGKPLTEPSAPSAVKSTEQRNMSNISFDDVFGSDDANESKPADDTPASVDLSAAPTSSNDHPPPPKVDTPVVAGVNEFDETLGKVPRSATATPANFSFDAAFDDNFDFASASKAAEYSRPQSEQQAQTLGNGDFDKLFETVNSVPGPSTREMPAIAQSTATVSPSNAPKFENAFEEAFTGFDSVTAPKLDDKLFTPTVTPSVPPTEGTFMPGSFPSSPAPAQASAPASPRNVTPASRAVEMRAVSPIPREKSPPPRMASPKPRLSSSSSKETNEKPKEPTARHSKLSIRLPFGKKKKHQESMPLPSSHLTPPIEQPQRIATPASDDDVEAVKQLTAMGFSRTQAVDALEKYGYDVQKALNSLLGQ